MQGDPQPEQAAEPTPEVAAPASAGLADALEGLLAPSRVEPVAASDAPPAADRTPAEAATDEPADEAPDSDGDAAAEAVDPPLTRKQRGALLAQKDQEITTLKTERDSLAQERDHFRSAAEQAGVLPDVARNVMSDFIGAKPVENSGGLPLFEALEQKSKTREGLSYEEQELYADLTEKRRIAGSLWSVASSGAWAQIAAHMVDPDYGMDEATVAEAGSMENYRRAYRAAIEKAVEQKVRAEYDGKLEEQRSQYEAKLARASRTSARAPVGSGRPVTNGAYTLAGNRGGDLISDMAAGLEEMEHSRAG
jgi:hypothetical protein